MSAKQYNKDHESDNVCTRNSQIDHTQQDQENCTDQKSNYGCLTDSTCDTAGKHSHCIAIKCSAFDHCQRSSSGHTIKCEACHRTCKCKKQEASSTKCRVHEVLSKSAKNHFYNNNGKCTTDDWNEERNGVGQVQAEK